MTTTTVGTKPDLSDAALARVTKTLASQASRYDQTAEFPSRLLQALGQGDPSVALLTAMTVLQHLGQAKGGGRWPDTLYRQVVQESYERPVLLNAIRAEPELGAPARGGLPATTVTRTENGWLLNGRKAYGTGSEGLAYHLVWAVTPDEEPLLGHVIVPGDTPGISVIRTWDHLGLRASSTHDVVYENVEVPAENFPGVPVSQATGGEAALFAGTGLSVVALYVGVARAAQNFFIRFANERVPTALGRPIATTERIQAVAGEIEAQLIQAEEVLYGLAGRLDADPQDGGALKRAGVAKLLITRSAITAVETALKTIGNPGLTRHNPLERHFRDIQCCRIHPPQDDTALIAAGRRTLSQPS